MKKKPKVHSPNKAEYLTSPQAVCGMVVPVKEREWLSDDLRKVTCEKCFRIEALKVLRRCKL